jgi:hypothetical protein
MSYELVAISLHRPFWILLPCHRNRREATNWQVIKTISHWLVKPLTRPVREITRWLHGRWLCEYYAVPSLMTFEVLGLDAWGATVVQFCFKRPFYFESKQTSTISPRNPSCSFRCHSPKTAGSLSTPSQVELMRREPRLNEGEKSVQLKSCEMYYCWITHYFRWLTGGTQLNFILLCNALR